MNETENSTTMLADLDVAPRPIFDNVTIIIPTLGRPVLETCLQAIVKGTAWPAHIIVVDQGSNARVIDWLHRVREAGIQITHIPSNQRSPSSARNRGIEQIQTLFVAAVDDDCLVEARWLEKMEMRLRQNQTAIITGRVTPAGDGIAPTIVTSDTPTVYRRFPLRGGAPLSTGNMGCALRIVQRIGPFDESLYTAEDQDWAYRAFRAGISVIYAPEVSVYHFHWRDEAQMAETYRVYARDQAAFYGKYIRKGDGSMVLRIAIRFARDVKHWMSGVILADDDRRANSCIRITQLLQGLVSGLRGGGR